MSRKDRVSLSSVKLDSLSPNLIESHLRSYKMLLENGIKEIFDEINPVVDYTKEAWEASFTDIEWGEVNTKYYKAKKLGLSYDRPLYAHTRLLNKKTGEIKKQRLFIADIPVMSDNATFVVKGNERVVVMQVIRAEGLLFFESKASSPQLPLYSVKLMPLRGRWFDFEINKHGIMSVKLLDKRPRILLTTLLRALGYSSDKDLENLFKDINDGEVDYLANTLRKDTTTSTKEALIDIYRKLKPEDSINIDVAKSFIETLFFNKRSFYLGRVGRYQLNKKLGIKKEITEDDYTLKKADLIKIIRSLVKINNKIIPVDDIDSLANRRIREVGELIGEKIRMGVLRMEKNIKDRMSTYSSDELVTPSVLINTRPIIAALNQFFGSSQVSRYMDQQNPLSELETKRRVTAGGPKGLTKERATFSVRDVHSSHYSRLCMVTTPEGGSIGIVSHLAIYARVNEYGFITAPYYKVYSELDVSKENLEMLVGRVLRSDAINKSNKVVLKLGDEINKENITKLIKNNVEKVQILPWVSGKVEYLDADDEVIFKIGSALLKKDGKGNIIEKNIFVRHERSYSKVIADQLEYVDINPGQIGGVGFSLIPFSYNDDPVRTLMASNMQRQAVPLLNPEAPIVGTGYERIVAEASLRSISSKGNGKVVYSDSDILRVEYDNGEKEEVIIEKFERTNQNTSFSQKTIVNTGQIIKKGDLLVDGPAMDNGELALGQNMVVAFMVWGGYNYEDGIILSEDLVKKDKFTSVHIKEYTQDIRSTKLGDEEITKDIPNVGDYMTRNLDEDGIVRIGANLQSQDILVGIIAPKGETEPTPEEKLLRAIFGEYARDVRDNSLKMPHGDTGIVIGVQVLDKSKGDKLNPGVLRQVKVWVAKTHKISVGDKLTGLHGDKGVISKILPVEDMPYLENGKPVDILLSPMFVKRMNVGGIRELEIAELANRLGIKVIVPPFAPIDDSILKDQLKEKGISTDIKVDLYDGRTGAKFDDKVVVGSRYIVKLDHLSSDKIHARSTGSYTMVTQQPLGGKAQFGGQRFGEMEVWALEAHAAPNVLHEMLTIKSDDVVGRAAAYKSIIQGVPIEPPSIPESFKVFISELRALGVEVNMVEPEIDSVDENDIAEGVATGDEITKLDDSTKDRS